MYTEDDLEVDWGVTGFNDGVTEGHVSIVGPSQAYATIQVALDEAVPGDTVAVSGVHTGNFCIDKAVFFRGYAGTRINSGAANQPVIRVKADGAYVKRFVTVGRNKRRFTIQ